MGMFDHITVKYPLPGAPRSPIKCQTKDLHCLLYDFELRENGELWLEKVEREYIENPDAFLGHDVNVVSRQWEPYPFTGALSVYDSIDGKWYEWSIWVIEGKVRDAIMFSPEPESNADEQRIDSIVASGAFTNFNPLHGIAGDE